MMTILQEKKHVNDDALDLSNVLVEVYPQKQQQQQQLDGGIPAGNDNKLADAADAERHAQDIFEEVNKSEPIKLVDMPGVAKPADRKVITNGAARLQDGFPEMFSPSQKCRPPHLNIDNLRDALFAADVLARHELKSAKALADWMIGQNELLKAKYNSGGESTGGDGDAGNNNKSPKVSETALKKANKFEFYLGLESGWLYN